LPVVIEQVTVNEHPVFNELQPLKFTDRLQVHDLVSEQSIAMAEVLPMPVD
jgi:hypothetical protein